MAVLAPFNLKKWIDEHRDLLKPPVGNQCIYKDAENFIVMVVGGPNARKDYHYNESEELYYQVEGNIVLKIIDEGVPKSQFRSMKAICFYCRRKHRIHRNVDPILLDW